MPVTSSPLDALILALETFWCVSLAVASLR
jgi:hypothetical protein